jgi:hypothetical protein
MDLKILSIIEEQVAVGFTGKVNVLSRTNRQYLGHLLLKEGEVIQAVYQHGRGLKAFFQLVIDEFSLKALDYVVEPEIVDEKERQIHQPLPVLKDKLQQVLKDHRDTIKLRPPQNLRILIQARFLDDQHLVTPEEFDVLNTLAEWNRPNDVYRHSPLLEHETTLALVGLRKKGALKIIGADQKTE